MKNSEGMQSVQAVAVNGGNSDPRTRRGRTVQRLTRLTLIEADVAKAMRALAQVLERGRSGAYGIVVRPSFIRRREPASGEMSDRKPPLGQKPPAIDLISPNGIAQQLILVALFVAQTRGSRSGGRVELRLPLEASSDEDQWIDLVVPHSTHDEKAVRAAARRDNRLRQVKATLSTLALKSIVDLPNVMSARGKYEGFQLFDEGGARPTGLPIPYTVPKPKEAVITIPLGFFLNGWVYVLTKSEIALWLMLRDLMRQGSDDGWVYITGEERLRVYGLSHDAYKTWPVLHAAGLIEVQIDPRRRSDGSLDGGFDQDDPALCHRFRLTDGGLEDVAVYAVRAVLAASVDDAD